MKQTYIIPTTTIIALSVSEHLLGASETPAVSVGTGKKDEFDVKSSTPSHDVWDDDWSK